mgnify:CR=1 FL=1
MCTVLCIKALRNLGYERDEIAVNLRQIMCGNEITKTSFFFVLTPGGTSLLFEVRVCTYVKMIPIAQKRRERRFLCWKVTHCSKRGGTGNIMIREENACMKISPLIPLKATFF